MEKPEYVLGFLFTKERNQVVLIQKQRPFWQKGYWNGVGGKLEENETPQDAMVRECEEETGVKIESWVNKGVLEDLQKTYKVYIFVAFDDHAVDCKTIKDEQIGVYQLPQLDSLNCLPNVQWLIKAMLDDNTVSIYSLHHK